MFLKKMSKQAVIKKISDEVKQRLAGEASGHDWWHVYRVWQMAKRLAKSEKADCFLVEVAALLHDISDWKFNNGDDTVGPKLAGKILKKHGVSEKIINDVSDIMLTMSYKGAKVKTPMKTMEGKIVQDADRLDAIGAIGIGRTFAYGGHSGHLMYEPGKKARLHKTKEDYFNSKGSTINHFYEKLLLLKDRMNTKSAQKIAGGRHKFMLEYLNRFYKEWEGLA